MKKKDVRLYNVLFPVWMMLLIPQVWLVTIPGNFLIDSLVLILAMKALKLEDRKGFYKKHILPVFLLGFLADLIAAGVMLGMLFLMEAVDLELAGNFVDGPVLTVPGVLLAAGLIFLFDYFISFRKCEKNLRRKLALTYAIATAPYTFLIPSRWIYG